MGFLPELPLQSGERLVWQVGCNRFRHGLARGGRLGLTDRALLFEPNAVDRLLAAKGFRIPLSDVREISQIGGLRSRMRVRLADGSEERLLVNQLDRRMTDIRAAITASGGSS